MRIGILQILLTTLCVMSVPTFSLAVGNTNRDPVVDHAWVGNTAEQIECLGADLRQLFAEQYRCSDVYRKLAWQAGKLRRQSARLHRQSKLKSSVRWQREINRLDETACELQQLVDQANTRVAQQLDPPLPVGAYRAGEMIAATKTKIAELYLAAGVATEVVNGPPIMLQAAPNYDPQATAIEAFVPTPLTPAPRFGLRRGAPAQIPTLASPENGKRVPMIIPPVPNSNVIPESTSTVLEPQLSAPLDSSVDSSKRIERKKE